MKSTKECTFGTLLLINIVLVSIVIVALVLMGILVVHRAVLRPFAHRGREVSPYLESGGAIGGGKRCTRRQRRVTHNSNQTGPPSYKPRNSESLSLGNFQRDSLAAEPPSEVKIDGKGPGEKPFRPKPDSPSSVGGHRESSLSIASAVPSIEERQPYQWTHTPNSPESPKKPCQAQIEHCSMVPSHCNATARNGSKHPWLNFGQGGFPASAPESSGGGCRLTIEEWISRLPRQSDTEDGGRDAQHTEPSHQCLPRAGRRPDLVFKSIPQGVQLRTGRVQ